MEKKLLHIWIRQTIITPKSFLTYHRQKNLLSSVIEELNAKQREFAFVYLLLLFPCILQLFVYLYQIWIFCSKPPPSIANNSYRPTIYSK